MSTVREDALAATLAEAPPAEGSSGVAIARGLAIGHFLVIETIGAGAMGTVVLAYDPALDRKVALKLLRPGVWTGPAATEGRQRLVREAQAMAKLSHPNVVTAYEVGTYKEHVFLAMEYVEGKTLGKWLADKERTWREVVDVFMQAGRGLAAAHAAGIVHRDFKPDNVLIAPDGRVRVGDFGLASVMGTPRPLDETLPVGAEPKVDGPGSMTRVGALIGTPAYMSPEQHKGEVADARADQFAFAVALAEALYGDRPYTGKTYREYADNVIAGKMREPPRAAKIPAWIRRIILRALAPDPAARFPSMDALLAALAADPAIKHKRIGMAAAVGMLVAVAAIGLVWRPSSESRLCKDAGKVMDGVWDDAARTTVEKAFVATGRPDAASTARRAAKILDGKAAALVAMRGEACEATHVRGEQSAALMDLRMACLDRRAMELRVLVDLFAKADTTIVDNAVEAALFVAKIDGCADTEALTSAQPPPEDPAARAEIARLREELARVESLYKGGKYKEAHTLAMETHAAAEKLGWSPLLADALASLAQMESRNARPKEAEASWRKVAEMAAAAKNDVLLARAWAYLVHVVGFMQSRHDEAKIIEDIARVQAKRAGEPADLMAELHNAMGARRFSQGEYKEAAELFESVRRERIAAHGPEHPGVANATANLALAVEGLGDYPRQLELTREVLALRERILGPEHPQTAQALHAIGTALVNAARYDEALAAFRKALAIREAVFGPDAILVADSMASVALVLVDISDDNAPEALKLQQRVLEIREKIYGRDHVQLANSLGSIASLYETMGKLDECRALRERVVELRTKAYGPDHPDVASALNNLSLVVKRQGDYDASRALMERTLAIRVKALGADHPDVGNALNNIAFLEYQRKRYAEAEKWYRKAIPIFEAKMGKNHPRTLDTLIYFGATLAELEKWDDSAAALDQALGGYVEGEHKDKITPNDLASVRFALAQSLRGARRDPERARALAKEARDGWEKLGDATSVAEVDKWLAKR